ncbi:hypothetical protein [Thiomicrorhabdus sp.]|uniref:hypothetical protein n=1 Tax=Thiomicrorhabdus sp. TaxID=2039724 RepID=UPI002AA6CD39|nr:hypothetical protein [Thiomicrorhabdus sp.]
MSSKLKAKKWIWLHYNHLNPEHKIFEHVKDYDAVLFIWDEDYFNSQFFSKQRMYFIWQCLTDFKSKNMTVIKGETDAVLKQIYREQPNTQIFTPENPAFNYKRWKFVEPLKQNQFIVFDQNVPFGFFKFWKEAKKQLFGDLK